VRQQCQSGNHLVGFPFVVRILDLCALSGFYRRFVFCFDQTEIYGHKPDLARCFGMVVSEMVRQSINQMTVVTANLDPWLKAIVPTSRRPIRIASAARIFPSRA
jgi:hypothetical protein